MSPFNNNQHNKNRTQNNCLSLFFTLLLPISIYNIYDTFSGKPISEEELKQHEKLNNTQFCVTDIEPCDPSEGSRIDGSCNNPSYPSRGAARTPFYRLLDAVYSKGFEPRYAKSGSLLPACRKIRTTVLGDGTLPDLKFTQLLPHFMVFYSVDIATTMDSNKVVMAPSCCSETGKSDYSCTPSPVPEDDPFLRFSDIRCLNLTRPTSFQSLGCLEKDTTPQRSDPSTPAIDLSQVYGVNLNGSSEKARSLSGGMLKQEVEDGRVWPPSFPSPDNICALNVKPRETRCHDTPDVGLNSVLGVNLVGIWFWRQHNKIASKLATLNPCWSDDKIFYTARDINIAIMGQILYYEAFPLLLGYSRMVSDKIIAKSKGFRDLYQPKLFPQMSLEGVYVLRWLHLVQDGRTKMFDPEGHYLKQIPTVNLTLRTGYLAIDSNIDYITQGSVRQASAKFDYLADPEISENGLAGLQRATDIPTMSLCRGRYFGLQPYVMYLNYCTGKRYLSFEDLSDFIDPERIELLKDLYQSVEDIDLMAGIWSERLIPGGYVPSTFYCLVAQYLKFNLMSDRHWFERPNRPNAFTNGQLKQIRKASMACMLCEVGDKVTKVTPRAFERISTRNPLVECSKIPLLDVSAWKDKSCTY